MSTNITADFIQPEDQFITEETVLNIGKENEENETPTESPTENKEEMETAPSAEDATTEQPKEDDNIPFHKHPRWIERENKWQEEKERLENELNSIKERVENPPVKEVVNTEIPDWFGGDEIAWSKYQAYQEQERQRVKQELIADQQQAVKSQKDAEAKWKKYTDDSIARLEAEGKEFDKNELMDVMLKWRPTDDYGNFDFSKGYEILALQKGTNNNAEKAKARKQMVDISSSKPTEQGTNKNYATSEDFRGKSLYDIVRD